MIALIVTLACLPLLVLDAMSGSTSSAATETASAASPEPSLVVAESPSTEAPLTVSTEASTTSTAPTVSAPATSTTTVAVRPAQVWTPPTTAAPVTTVAPVPVMSSDSAFLACVRERESHGDYTAADPSGTYLGAYQIYQGGWDAVAASIGRNDLIGVAPNLASPADQDRIALAMLQQNGRGPWGGFCS